MLFYFNLFSFDLTSFGRSWEDVLYEYNGWPWPQSMDVFSSLIYLRRKTLLKQARWGLFYFCCFILSGWFYQDTLFSFYFCHYCTCWSREFALRLVWSIYYNQACVSMVPLPVHVVISHNHGDKVVVYNVGVEPGPNRSIFI